MHFFLGSAALKANLALAIELAFDTTNRQQGASLEN